MPILLKLTYKNKQGKIVHEVGPGELYLPKVKSLERVNNKIILDALENELEGYNWAGQEDINVEWVVLATSVH